MSATQLLASDLDRLAAAGRKTPCQYVLRQGDERFISEDRDERESARGLCAGCPVLDLCRAAAIEEQCSWGVRGGVDFSDSRTRRAARRQHHRKINRSETA
ncbi:WhiB family transcriptional regulator [Mobilicoccus massiliensis]|uniref:WhiB family transcriptional regulator n=1 Tax=Mobilicoccus massiliensis TaxID=1522310 RepID=UPI00059182EB|nr:WhiB family transcriptional regulator [Mobilicoccus massiliensis]